MSEALKPCPFCGSDPIVLETPKSFFYRHDYKIGCRNELCMVKPATEWFIAKEAAITAWNKRKEMNYYCDSCGTVFTVTDKTDMRLYGGDKEMAENRGIHCGVCDCIPSHLPSWRLKALPAFETPKRYEARTGKKPDGKAVWFKLSSWKTWSVMLYEHVPGWKPKKGAGEKIIVMVNGPDAPPDDWTPEGADV